MDDVLAAEEARYERRVRRQRVVAVAIVAGLAAGGWLLYRAVNGFPADHGLSALPTEGSYSLEVWECIIDIFERRPLPGTLSGEFVVEAVYREPTTRSDVRGISGFRVEAAFGSEEYQIGDGQLIYYSINEFGTYATLTDCSDPSLRTGAGS